MYTEYLYPIFYDHPPLAFGLQAIFFKIFGDYYFTERLYSFCTLLITIYFIIRIWNYINKNEEKNHWIPIVLFLITPVVSWSYRNNMLENTLGMFTIISIYFQVKSIFSQRDSGFYYFNFFISGIFITLALLAKGLVGLFPIAFPFLYFILNIKSISFPKMIAQTLILLLPAMLFAAIFYFNEESKIFFTNYFDNQVIQSLLSKREKITSSLGRYYIIYRLIMEILPMVILGFIFYSYTRIKKVVITKQPYSLFLLFLLIGISGSLPISISPKQSNFYLIPALPYFAIAFGILYLPSIDYLTAKDYNGSQGIFYLNSLLLFSLIAVIVFL
jgi:4-amino-4-deoxy-L-arabinose transferase-like glycosyltransferase